MIRYAFVTVTDRNYFPGTLATLGSVFEFHPQATVYVLDNAPRGLSEAQAGALCKGPRVRLLAASEFARDGRYIDAWELKAYGMCDLAERGEFDVLVGIDSDCLLCGDVDREIRQCVEFGGFMGGADGEGADYDEAYAIYGIATPQRNDRYMSTSLYFCAVNDANKAILRRWAQCCAAAVFNGRGPYPGHGDQGVLNAVLFAAQRGERVHLLDNALWSQHWTYWQADIGLQDGGFVNRSAGGRPQRAFHCVNGDKFWMTGHRDRVLAAHAAQAIPYAWFLAMLWFGRCHDESADPFEILEPHAHHLVDDLVHELPLILQAYPAARQRWNAVSERLLDRLLDGIPRAMELHGGSLSEAIELVAGFPNMRRCVHLGVDDGGSVLALALRFVNRDLQFYAVESLDHRLASWSRAAHLALLARFPSLRVQAVPGDSASAAARFGERSVDMLFIGASDALDTVLRDVDAWRARLAPGGVVAGDRYDRPAVKQAVEQRFREIFVSPSGRVWWTWAAR
jgi:hypothetical protein